MQYILGLLAKIAINRYQPAIIGITGSVGKTTTKDAISSILGKKFFVRKSEKNYNNEIGVPNAILGIDTAGNIIDKLYNLLLAFWISFGPKIKNYPEILVLELAADRPGDINYLVRITKPKIGVITAVGEIPVHVEFYAGPKEVAKEKSWLIKSLPAHEGLAVLNYDDQTVLDMKELSKAKVVTFGLNEGADVWASGASYFLTESNDELGGMSFKINNGQTFIPVRVSRIVGSHQIYSILAASAVALHFGMNLVDISLALEDLDLSDNRNSLKKGIKHSWIIDDTYNASPLSTHAALDTLNGFGDATIKLKGKGKKIAVLGDMKELGKYEIDAHRSIGIIAGQRCDVLVTVGAAAKFIAETALEAMDQSKVFSFSTSEEAKSKVQELMEEGDVVLIKGSRSIKMEKIVEEIIAFLS